MPEGDVLRRTATRLDQALAGRVLVRAELRWPSVATVDLVGRTVLGTAPYGKHLLTRFDDGRTLHTHLRMEGSWRIARTGTPAARAGGQLVRAMLGAETWTAIGDRLGMVDIVATRDEHTLIGHLGPDLLGADFPGAGLVEALRRWDLHGADPACDVLLDQGVAAGIGTIWMAESLFARRIWPWTPADRVDAAAVLTTARTLMGRSAAAFAASGGSRGVADVGRQVHGRLRQPCSRCGTPIAVGTARKPPQERPVFYCPTCQHA
ncbi:MAG TPA: DNA-formamidopyrimidine glycosylase family protein [Cellulomonas sp.]|nr:DNA-formamidopyrimidine glycosylase family protein [Cellulomonas sp.]